MGSKRKSAKLANRIQALRIRHEMLEGRIAEEMKSLLPNVFVLQRLKRQKLKVKEEVRFLKIALGSIDPTTAPSAA